MQKDELIIVKEKTRGMEKMLDQFEITDDRELGIVADKIKQVKILLKFIKGEKDKLVGPAKAIIAEAGEKYDPYIKKCQNAEETLKERAKKYMLQKEAKRQEEEKRIAARVEKGTMKTETAIKKLETLDEVPKTVRTDTGSGLRMSKRRVAEISDPNLVPKEYWIIDEVRVRREALERDKQNLPQIPGIVVRDTADLSSI